MDTALKYPKFRWLVLMTILGGQLVAGSLLLAFTPLFPDMVSTLFPDITGPQDPEFGSAVGSIAFAVMGLMMFTGAAGMLCGGFLVDKFGVFKMMIISLSITALTFALTPVFGGTIAGLATLRIIAGFGGSFFTAAITPTIAIWFPRAELGKAMGIQGIGMGIGMGLGLNIGPTFASVTGNWQTGTALLAILPVAVLLFMITVAIKSKKYVSSLPSLNEDTKLGDGPKLGGPVQATSLRDVTRFPVFWVGMAVSALCFWVGNGFNDLSPSFLAAQAPLGAGYDAVASGRISSIASIAGIIGPVLAGVLVDNAFKGRGRGVILIGWVIAAICFPAIAFEQVHGSLSVLIPVMFIAGFMNPFISVTINAFAAKTFPPHLIGRTIGLWMSVASFAGAAGISIGSLALRSTGNYNVSFIIVAVLSVVAFIVSLFIKSPTEGKAADGDGDSAKMSS